MVDMRSELCKTCIHTKVCRNDKNIVGDVFVMGHPLAFDNRKLWDEYKKREEQGFPCEDYMPTAEPKKGKWIDYTKDGYVECPFCHSATNCDGNEDELHFCFSCGADMRGAE